MTKQTSNFNLKKKNNEFNVIVIYFHNIMNTYTYNAHTNYVKILFFVIRKSK